MPASDWFPNGEKCLRCNKYYPQFQYTADFCPTCKWPTWLRVNYKNDYRGWGMFNGEVSPFTLNSVIIVKEEGE
eukprot:g49358.t1